MTRPLLVTDCDEVLLHMVRHFGDWLGEVHDIDFALETGRFGDALTRRADGRVLTTDETWPLLDGFFADQMHRQTLVPGALAALERIGAVADIVVLTNLKEQCRIDRIAQLAAHGIRHEVQCNQGGKGRPVGWLIEERAPSVAVFVDDLAVHHESVARHRPEVWRLHMVAEPRIAPAVAAAPHAHARIDDWDAAAAWILARFADGVAAG